MRSGGYPLLSAAESHLGGLLSESEEIAVLSKRISELAARRRFLRSNCNPGQGGAQVLETGRGVSVQGTRPRFEEFPPLSPGMTPGAGDRRRDRGTVRMREPVRVETPTHETGAQSVRRGSRPPPSSGAVTGRIPRNTNIMKRRPPRSAAVICTDTTLSYSDALRKARENIGPLDKLGIEDFKMRRGVNGGLIIEFLGPENVAKADALAQKLRETLKDEARISRPTTNSRYGIWMILSTLMRSETWFPSMVTVAQRMSESGLFGRCIADLTLFGLNVDCRCHQSGRGGQGSDGLDVRQDEAPGGTSGPMFQMLEIRACKEHMPVPRG